MLSLSMSSRTGSPSVRDPQTVASTQAGASQVERPRSPALVARAPAPAPATSGRTRAEIPLRSPALEPALQSLNHVLGMFKRLQMASDADDEREGREISKTAVSLSDSVMSHSGISKTRQKNARALKNYVASSAFPDCAQLLEFREGNRLAEEALSDGLLLLARYGSAEAGTRACELARLRGDPWIDDAEIDPARLEMSIAEAFGPVALAKLPDEMLRILIDTIAPVAPADETEARDARSGLEALHSAGFVRRTAFDYAGQRLAGEQVRKAAFSKRTTVDVARQMAGKLEPLKRTEALAHILAAVFRDAVSLPFADMRPLLTEGKLGRDLAALSAQSIVGYSAILVGLGTLWSKLVRTAQWDSPGEFAYAGGIALTAAFCIHRLLDDNTNRGNVALLNSLVGDRSNPTRNTSDAARRIAEAMDAVEIKRTFLPLIDDVRPKDMAIVLEAMCNATPLSTFTAASAHDNEIEKILQSRAVELRSQVIVRLPIVERQTPANVGRLLVALLRNSALSRTDAPGLIDRIGRSGQTRDMAEAIGMSARFLRDPAERLRRIKEWTTPGGLLLRVPDDELALALAPLAATFRETPLDEASTQACEIVRTMALLCDEAGSTLMGVAFPGEDFDPSLELGLLVRECHDLPTLRRRFSICEAVSLQRSLGLDWELGKAAEAVRNFGGDVESQERLDGARFVLESAVRCGSGMRTETDAACEFNIILRLAEKPTWVGMSERHFGELMGKLLNCAASFEASDQGIMIAALGQAAAQRYARDAEIMTTSDVADAAIRDRNIVDIDRAVRAAAKVFPVMDAYSGYRPKRLRDMPDLGTSFGRAWSASVAAADARLSSDDRLG